LSYSHIRERQQEDEKLLALLKKNPDNYFYDSLDDDVEDIICYRKYADKDDWKIALPESMVPEVITWFHQVLGHPGQTRLRETLQQRYYHPQLRGQIDRFRCEHCQRFKLSEKDMVCYLNVKYVLHLGKNGQSI
jgi:hypothetical protein